MVLIFDYDGTIHNTARLYGCAFRKAYKMLVTDGYAEEHYYSDEYMSKYLGMTAEEMWQDFMPDLPPDITKRTAAELGREMVNQVFSGSAVLYDGISEVLDKIKNIGYTTVILSNCHREYLEAHKEHFRLDRWFDGYYCAEDFGNVAKEEIFVHIKKEFPDEKYIVIGDRYSDFKVGIVHYLPTIGCAYGFGLPSELSYCTEVINSPSELVRVLKKL